MALKVAQGSLIHVDTNAIMDELYEASYRWTLYNRLPKSLLESPYVQFLDSPYESFTKPPPKSIYRFEWMYPIPSFDFEEFDQCIADAEECISDSESLISSARSGTLDLPYPFHDPEYDVSVSGKPCSDEDGESEVDAHSDSDCSMHDDFVGDTDQEPFDAEGVLDHKAYSWSDDEDLAEDGMDSSSPATIPLSPPPFPWSPLPSSPSNPSSPPPLQWSPPPPSSPPLPSSPPPTDDSHSDISFLSEDEFQVIWDRFLAKTFRRRPLKRVESKLDESEAYQD